MSDHPAVYPPQVLDAIDRALGYSRTVLDPFAGVGGIHALYPKRQTYGIEIEREWAEQHERTVCGDAAWVLPSYEEGCFDAVATSPAYGNRMADQYDGRDGSKRFTYRLALGRPLTPGNSGGLQWGPEYRALHEAVWAECFRVVSPGGLFVLNCKDHIRKGRRQFVTAWHVATLCRLGFKYLGRERVPLRGIGLGANGGVRVGFEVVVRMGRPSGV